MSSVNDSQLQEEPQRPDYAAACEFMSIPFGVGLWLLAVFLAPIPSSSHMRALVGAFILIGPFVVSYIGWSLLARACERRRGEEGRTVTDILRRVLTGFAVPLAVGAIALSLTDSLLLGFVVASVIWTVMDLACAGVMRKLRPGA